MPYENSGTPASLISHALNEILALGIPRYTYGQLVATAFFCIFGKEIQLKYSKKKIMHKRSKQDSTGRNHSLSATRSTQLCGYPPCAWTVHTAIVVSFIYKSLASNPVLSCKQLEMVTASGLCLVYAPCLNFGFATDPTHGWYMCVCRYNCW